MLINIKSSTCEEEELSLENETATWPYVYQMGPPSLGGGGASSVMGASQGVSPLPNLHNLQLIT